MHSRNISLARLTKLYLVFLAGTALTSFIIRPLPLEILRVNPDQTQFVVGSELGRAAIVSATNISKDSSISIAENTSRELYNSYDFFWVTYWLSPRRVDVVSGNDISHVNTDYLLIRNDNPIQPKDAYELRSEYITNNINWVLYERGRE